MEGSKFVGSANNAAPFNESDIDLSKEALAEIDKQDWGTDKPDDHLDDDDEGTFQVIPQEEPVKSKETNSEESESEDPEKSKSETHEEQPKDKDDKGDGDEPPEAKTVSYDELTKDLEKDTEIELSDPVTGDKVHLSELLDDYKKVIEDHQNDENWRKTNTEKSQELSDERTAFDKEKGDFENHVKDYDEKVGAMNIEDVIKAIKTDHFLGQTDDYFDGKENNPLRKVLEAVDGLQTKQETAKADAEAEETKYADNMAKAIQKDIDAIVKEDDSYKDDKKMNELAKFAGENAIRFPIAKKVMEHATLTTANADLSTKVEKLTKELKERNEEVKRLREMPGVEDAILEPSEKSSGPGKERYSKQADSWEEAERRVNEKLGL